MGISKGVTQKVLQASYTVALLTREQERFFSLDNQESTFFSILGFNGKMVAKQMFAFE